MLAWIISKCKYPFWIKENKILVHPVDASRFLQEPSFVSVVNFPYTHEIAIGQIGRIYGYDIIIQDDIQILLLAMRGKRNENKN